MSRVVKPDGLIAIGVWSDIEQNPYFAALIGAVGRFLGEEVAAGLGAAFTLTEASEIEKLFVDSGLKGSKVEIQDFNLDLPQIDKFVLDHIGATPMAAAFSKLPESSQKDLANAVADKLGRYETATGVTVPFQIHVGKAVC